MAGLVVIVVLGLYTALAVFVAKRVGRLAKGPVGRNVIVVSVVAILLVAPVADGIYGYFVLQRLCATEAKTEVLRPIKIPAEYFNPDGSPRFVIGKLNSIDWHRLRGAYEIKHFETTNYRVPNLDRVVSTLNAYQTREVLARQTNFYYRGGWLQFNSEGIGNATCIARPSLSEVLLGRSAK
ncbi:MAG: hypothetical protein HYU75_12700 [Betaproteobacteria bacterium]|nr:hypothetical protein [Betaproteobacteria bacterium]